MYLWRHIRAVLALPFNVCIVIPSILVIITRQFLPSWQFQQPLLTILGAIIFTAGLALLFQSIRLFFVFGNGTLAPWDPPKKLVVRGVYRYSRNPMISGVFGILLGEALFFASPLLVAWFLFFVTAKLVYIASHEHDELIEYFGDDYLRYAENVPAWIPRLTPWEQDSKVAVSTANASPYTKVI